jgi:hypothetical protein
MKADGVTTVTLGSADITDLTWKDFRDAVYKVPAEERKDCAWFLNETVLNHIANIEDADGRPIWCFRSVPGLVRLLPVRERFFRSAFSLRLMVSPTKAGSWADGQEFCFDIRGGEGAENFVPLKEVYHKADLRGQEPAASVVVFIPDAPDHRDDFRAVPDFAGSFFSFFWRCWI